MYTRIITPEAVSGFEAHLVSRERSPHTIERYLHDVRAYTVFLGGREVTSETTCDFKQELIRRDYEPSSINTILASLFSFFKFMGWIGCATQRMVIQRDAYCREDRELTRKDYEALLDATKGSKRNYLVISSLCSTGTRASELRYFTVEAVRTREIVVSCKRKFRHVMIPEALGRALERYAEQEGIPSGPIFLGRRGKPLSRGRVWAILKEAGLRAGVAATKVFPHNLRKLFARTFYNANHDVVKLADVLGHSSIETTRIYTKSSGAEHRRLVDALGLAHNPKNPFPKHKKSRGKGKRAKK